MAVAASSLPMVDKSEERRVIFASSLGTVFEWYDFYIYAVLAPFFAGSFFPPGNQTTALLNAFVTYAAGFLVRPRHHHRDGPVDIPRRLSPDLQHRRDAGPDAARLAAAGTGPGTRR